jgi:outer membrane receptor protein involved in Fe transport
MKVIASTGWTYELGTRWELFDKSLVAEAGVYRTDWKNVNFDFALPPLFILAVANVGNERIYGTDLALDWITPVEGLSLSASGNLQDAYVTSVVSPLVAIQTNLKPGGRMPNVPNDNFTLSADYIHPLDWFDGMAWTFDATYAFRDREIDPTAMIGGEPARSGRLNDLGIRTGLEMGRWKLEAFVLNALNDKGPSTLATIPYPLRAGLRATVNF